MLEYKGQYTTATVMIDSIDLETVKQIYNFINHPVFTNPVIIMPDTHAGEGAVIGFTMEMTDKIIPNIVGVDIYCSMLSYNVGGLLLDLYSREYLDKEIRKAIPFGTSVHQTCKFNNNRYSPFWIKANHDLSIFVSMFNKRYGTTYKSHELGPEWLKNKSKEIGIEYERVLNSIGTLGGGNHFIELNQSLMTNDYWFTVHSGSRQFGLKIATYWQKKAGPGKLDHLEGDDMFNYLADVSFVKNYSFESKSIMQELIYKITKQTAKEKISTAHNFIDLEDFIIRKGAIRSYKNEKMIIPFNMEDGIIICEGKSNPEWNFSAPHGAGRLGSRRWAKENLSFESHKDQMEKKNIYCSKLPLDEVKGAYKDSKIIEEAIEPTATIIDRLVPVLAMKE